MQLIIPTLISLLATSVSAYVNGEPCVPAQRGLFACADAFEALQCDGSTWVSLLLDWLLSHHHRYLQTERKLNL